MTVDNAVPAERCITCDGTEDRAVLVGPSLAGWIYQSTERGCAYRVLPLEKAAIDWRYALRQAKPQTADGVLLSPDADWQPEDDARSYVLRYPLPARARFLHTVWQQAAPAERLRVATDVVRTAGHWLALGRDFQPPTTADIVIWPQGGCGLLWAPPVAAFGVDDVFDDPRRALYLAPEWVRHSSQCDWESPATWEAMARFALAVCVWQALVEFPMESRPQALLQRAAAGLAVDEWPRRRDLPGWFDRFPIFAETLKQLELLAHRTPEIRRAVHTDLLASQLEHSTQLADPHFAATRLRDEARPGEALNLLQEVLPLCQALGIDQTGQYDLLLLAAQLCASYLGRPLEAIDYLERAITLAPQRAEAYTEHFRLLTNVRHHPALAHLIATNRDVAARLDDRVERDFRVIENHTAPGEALRAYIHGMARYLLGRGRFEAAVAFVYPRLFDDQKRYLWWDFDANLAYVEGLAGMVQQHLAGQRRIDNPAEVLDKARKQLEIIKSGLRRVEQNRTLPRHVIHAHGDGVAQLERRLHHLAQTLGDRT